jgi:predicted Ser/Thr protein kinase
MSGQAMDSWIVGRLAHAKILADRLMYSRGGAFLVTGFRGVGKTTFVHYALQLIRNQKANYAGLRGDFELLDVWINISRPVQPSQLMHLIIRHLYLRLKEASLLASLDADLQDELETAFLRTSFEISSKSMDAEETNLKAEFGYRPVKWLGLDFFGKLDSSRTQKHSKENALQYLPYDDRAAEFDIAKFASRLAQGISAPRNFWNRLRHWFGGDAAPGAASRGIKVVFVFDELDKLAKFSTAHSDVMDSLLESLKGVFTSNEFSFVFIAGKEVYERWTQDVALGDSIYESIFAYDFYVPCLWKEQEEFVQKCIAESLSGPSETHSPAWHLTRFLQYRGRGVLRRMLRELNNCVVWEDNRPKLRVPREHVGSIGLFSKLQEVLSERVDLFGIDVERVDQARWDRRRLGLYYTLDWILATRGDSFSVTDVKAAGKNLKLGAIAEWVSHEDYAERILTALLERGFLERDVSNATVINVSNPGSSRYRLSDWVVLAFEQGADDVPEMPSPQPKEPQYSSAAQPLGERKQIGKYRIESVLGRGGMGTVYRCVSPEGRNFALKVLNQRIDQEDGAVRKRFENEIRVLRTLSHPNIVQIVDSGTDHDQFFFVMELVDGEPLDAVLGRVKICEPNSSICIVRHLAETFSYVHEQGIIRNDIKPSNMILTRRGAVKLVDFGIAAFASEHTGDTDTNPSIVGSVRYLSPERVSGKPPTAQSDVFSLGVVLYELITGQNPFDADNPTDILINIVRADPIPPSRLVPLSSELNDLILRSLAKNPGDRLATMVQFAARLKRMEQPVDLRALLQKSESAGEKVAFVRKEETEEAYLPAEYAARSAAYIGPAAAQSSADLESGTVEERVGKIHRMIAVSGPSSAPALLPFLRDAEAKVRLTAFWELAKLNPPDVFDLLFDFVLDVCFFTNPDQSKISLRRGRITLGRLPDSDFCLPRREISRRHLMFFIQEGTVIVEALASGNGLRLGGQPVSRAELSDGTVLSIAAIEFRVHIHRYTAQEFAGSDSASESA